MYGYNLVAIYSTLEEARRVSDRLLAEGLTTADVRLTDTTTGTADTYVEREPRREGGFFDWLFASDVPEYDRTRYTNYLNENRAAVSVHVPDDHWHDRVIAIMEEFNPIDIEEDGHALTQEHYATDTTSASSIGMTAASTNLGTTAGTELSATARTDMSREREEVIPIVKEELEVGKRVTERRYRVKSYIVERPIEKTVTVRDERVEIEHRPISRTGDLSMPQEREIEVIERHEEPFAEKRVTGTEEIVVRKEVVEHPETVRGTVRETKVDVDKEPVDKTAATTTTTDRTGGTVPPTPRRTDR
jgi:Domain of unknown function (DUF2382)